MARYSTAQVTKLLEISSSTLWRWITGGEVKVPPVQTVGGVQVRLWDDEDVQRLRKYKAEHYWGKGGRKPRKNKKN